MYGWVQQTIDGMKETLHRLMQENYNKREGQNQDTGNKSYINYKSGQILEKENSVKWTTAYSRCLGF